MRAGPEDSQVNADDALEIAESAPITFAGAAKQEARHAPKALMAPPGDRTPAEALPVNAATSARSVGTRGREGDAAHGHERAWIPGDGRG
jgi:hypothetical protein